MDPLSLERQKICCFSRGGGPMEYSKADVGIGGGVECKSCESHV